MESLARRVVPACLFAVFFVPFLASAQLTTTKIDGITVSKTTADILKGGCDSDPYPYLEQRHSGDKSNSFVTPRAKGNSLGNGLDPVLACRLKKLLEAAEAKGCRITINSAERPVQRCNPSGGACARQGNSCHQPGRAADLGGTPQCLAWLTQVIGRKNKNSPFGLHVAYQENGNYRHVQCVEHLVANQSSAGGCRTSCDGRQTFSGDTSATPPPSSFANTPSAGLKNLFAPQQPTSPSTPIPSQPLASSPTSYFPGTSPTTPTTPTTPTVPTIPTTPTIPTVPTPSTTGTTTGTSTGDGFDVDYIPYQPSVGEKLLELAYGTTKDPGVVATTTKVIVSGTDVAVLSGGHASTTNATGSSTVAVEMQPPNTFTSPDLAYYTTPAADATGFARTLLNLEEMVRAILEVLQPMGISAAIANGGIGHVHE